MSKGLLVILSGPSGVGKGAVRRILMEDKSLDLAYSVSMTTRKPRRLEQDGVDYFFVDEATFNEHVKNGDLLEHASFVGNQYGTPKAYVNNLRDQGKNVLLEIEVQGARQILEQSKASGDDIVSIFLIPPSMAALEKRIRKRRTEPEEIIQARLAKARSELGEKYKYKYIVLNDIVTRAADEIKDILKKEIASRSAES
jgi:guanylate kinase